MHRTKPLPAGSAAQPAVPARHARAVPSREPGFPLAAFRMTNFRRRLPVLAGLAVTGLAAGCATTSASSAPPTAHSSSTASAAAHAPSSPSVASSPGCGGSNSSGNSGVPALAAIQFAGASHGWAVGDGRILATSDGGRTWTRQYSGPAALYQVDFTDASDGWAVGAGALLRTTDGGATWTALTEPCQAIDAVSFVSPSVGYAVAGGAGGTPVLGSLTGAYSGSRLLRTADGGTTWQQLTGTPADPQSACFTSAATGYLGTPGKIWRTGDGGQAWSLAFTEPPAAKGFSKPLDTPELQCAGPAGAWVLFLGTGAAMMHSPYLAYTTQDGRTWHGVLEETMLESAIRPGLHLPDGPGSEPGPFSAISPSAAAFVGSTPPANGYGAAPLALATDNGSALKNAGDVAAINQPFAAAFLTPAQGWVVGENLQTKTFAIEATTNSGRTWTTQYQTT
jgi:photosystem II stability/assembly factor-like uncharacterized protein